MTARLLSHIKKIYYFALIIMFLIPKHAHFQEYITTDSFIERPLITPVYVQSDPLEDWIEKLALKESGNNPNIIVKDTNGKLSKSCLQFQDSTWESMSKKYGVKGNIMDCGLQKTLAYVMIKDDYNNWKHWRCSVEGCTKYRITGIGLPPVI